MTFYIVHYTNGTKEVYSELPSDFEDLTNDDCDIFKIEIGSLIYENVTVYDVTNDEEEIEKL